MLKVDSPETNNALSVTVHHTERRRHLTPTFCEKKLVSQFVIVAKQLFAGWPWTFKYANRDVDMGCLNNVFHKQAGS